MFPKAYLIGAMIVVGLIALAAVARNWSCRQTWADRREERREERRQRSVTCKVLDVLDGARLLVAWGRRDRGQREVILQGVEVPPNASVSAPFHLEGLTAGGSVRIDYVHHGLLGDWKDESCSACGGSGMSKVPEIWIKSHPDSPTEQVCWACGGDKVLLVECTELEATTPIVGIVYGDGNVCLNVEQIFAGLAKCNADANDVQKAAEKAAKREKKGIWR